MNQIFALLTALSVLFGSAFSAGRHASPEEAMFNDFGEAAETAGEFSQVREEIDYLAVAMEKDGKYIRAVALTDSKARQLCVDFLSADDSGEAYEAYREYAWSLPVSYIEEITAQPKEQTELDSLAGKTVGELLQEGYSVYGAGGGIGLPTVVDMAYGVFTYEFEADVSYEDYLAREGLDDLGDLKLKSGKLYGFSPAAADLDYRADGVYDPEIVPDKEPESVYEEPAFQESVEAEPADPESP